MSAFYADAVRLGYAAPSRVPLAPAGVCLPLAALGRAGTPRTGLPRWMDEQRRRDGILDRDRVDGPRRNARVQKQRRASESHAQAARLVRRSVLYPLRAGRRERADGRCGVRAADARRASLEGACAFGASARRSTCGAEQAALRAAVETALTTVPHADHHAALLRSHSRRRAERSATARIGRSEFVLRLTALKELHTRRP